MLVTVKTLTVSMQDADAVNPSSPPDESIFSRAALKKLSDEGRANVQELEKIERARACIKREKTFLRVKDRVAKNVQQCVKKVRKSGNKEYDFFIPFTASKAVTKEQVQELLLQDLATRLPDVNVELTICPDHYVSNGFFVKLNWADGEGGQVEGGAEGRE